MATHKTDSQIKQDVIAELKWTPEVKETDIGVIVKDGAVTLTGTVPHYVQKAAACRAAARVKGVRAIAEDIEVKLPCETKGTDKDIAEHIARIFEWNSVVPADNVKAEVLGGYVTLKGEVDWQYQRDYAERQIEAVKGVRKVINNMTLRTRASEDNVRREIVQSLHRHASIAGGRVSVLVKDGTVTLNGDVDSYYEKMLVNNAAWQAAGVSKVVDHLVIAPVYTEEAA